MRHAGFMPDAAAVRAIGADLDAYNAERDEVHRSVRGRLVQYFAIFTASVVVAAFAIGTTIEDPGSRGGAFGVLLVVAVVGGFWVHAAAVKPAKTFQQRLRDRIIPSALGFVEDVRYANKVKPASFERMPKAAVGSFNRTAIDDSISGRHEGVPFDLFEAVLSYKSGKSEQTMFRGVILAFPMPDPFPGTLIATKTVGGVSRFMRDLFGKGGLEPVLSGNPALDEAYEFRSDNPEAARPLVTGSFARALDLLREAWPEEAARVALSGSDGFLLLPSKKNFFELPPVSQPCAYDRHVEPMVGDVSALLATSALVRRIG